MKEVYTNKYKKKLEKFNTYYIYIYNFIIALYIQYNFLINPFQYRSLPTEWSHMRQRRMQEGSSSSREPCFPPKIIYNNIVFFLLNIDV